MKTERAALLASSVACLVLGVLGLGFAALTGAEAILLDGLFNITYFVTGLFAIKVAQLVQRGDDSRFPFGYAFFEPLINGVKGVLVLGVSLMALAGAVEAFMRGGRAIDVGFATIYGAVASATAWTVAAIMRRASGDTSSPLVDADAKNWSVNALISSAVLAAFALVFVLDRLGFDRIVPYVDPTLVTIVVIVSIGVPVRMAWNALMSMLARAVAPGVVAAVRSAVENGLDGLPVRDVALRVIEPGRMRFVSGHVLLESGTVRSIKELDAARARVVAAVRAVHPPTDVDLLFTEDERWFAPLPGVHSGR